MSEVFLDTETTGLSFKDGHKIVEIACIETRDLITTGKVFHKIINPERNVPDEAFKIHGFSSEFLRKLYIFKLLFTKVFHKSEPSLVETECLCLTMANGL